MSADNEGRYLRAMHAVQSGVAAEMNIDPGPTEPKHLRVGVNSALITASALVGLLISKGVITADEYDQALADCAEEEQRAYEQRLSEHFGRKVTLG